MTGISSNNLETKEDIPVRLSRIGEPNAGGVSSSVKHAGGRLVGAFA